jgi:hypothetical protein
MVWYGIDVRMRIFLLCAEIIMKRKKLHRRNELERYFPIPRSSKNLTEIQYYYNEKRSGSRILVAPFGDLFHSWTET